MTLDGAGTALFGSDLREPAPQITGALTNLLAGFRIAMAPGGPTLLRFPLPVAMRYVQPRPSSRPSSTT